MRDRDIHPGFQDVTVAVQIPYLLISQSKVEIDAGVSLLIAAETERRVEGMYLSPKTSLFTV
jgi:hypothetical protein